MRTRSRDCPSPWRKRRERLPSSGSRRGSSQGEPASSQLREPAVQQDVTPCATREGSRPGSGRAAATLRLGPRGAQSRAATARCTLARAAWRMITVVRACVVHRTPIYWSPPREYGHYARGCPDASSLCIAAGPPRLTLSCVRARPHARARGARRARRAAGHAPRQLPHMQAPRLQPPSLRGAQWPRPRVLQLVARAQGDGTGRASVARPRPRARPRRRGCWCPSRPCVQPSLRAGGLRA